MNLTYEEIQIILKWAEEGCTYGPGEDDLLVRLSQAAKSYADGMYKNATYECP